MSKRPWRWEPLRIVIMLICFSACVWLWGWSSAWLFLAGCFVGAFKVEFHDG